MFFYNTLKINYLYKNPIFFIHIFLCIICIFWFIYYKLLYNNLKFIYNRIISTLDTDQYNTLIAILGQRDENEEKRHVEYIIPAATCPKCGKLIPERVLSLDSGNGTIETQLFTRRPLALMASTSTT